jgi:hypothetical protein
VPIHRISIKFCGGCNPRIDRGRIAEKVKAYFSESGYEVIYNNLDADFIIYLSGCPASCAKHYSTSGAPCVVIAACTIDAVVVEENEISTQIIDKARDYFERLEKRLPQ